MHRAHAELASPLAPRLPRPEARTTSTPTCAASELNDSLALTIRARSAVVCAGFVDGLLALGRRAPGSSSKPHIELVQRRLPCLGGTWPLRSNRCHGQPVHRDPLVATTTSPRGARGHAATLMGRPAACASPRSACDALRARMAILCARSSPGAADECVPRRALAARGAFCPSPITCARGELPSCAASDRKLLVARCVWSAAQRARALDGSVYCVLLVCVWLAHASVE